MDEIARNVHLYVVLLYNVAITIRVELFAVVLFFTSRRMWLDVVLAAAGAAINTLYMDFTYNLGVATNSIVFQFWMISASFIVIISFIVIGRIISVGWKRFSKLA
jgi:hypothetical protein